ncbi:MAG TPA: hypothetical protein VK079_02030 [Bacillota bacterium]|nr:hypothetical protein [Bacillota bacterium]
MPTCRCSNLEKLVDRVKQNEVIVSRLIQMVADLKKEMSHKQTYYD